MKVNVVYALPAADSYHASLHQRILRTLSARGDEVIDFDLYAMQFEPAMGEEEWQGHKEPPRPPPQDLKVYIDALKWADACVFLLSHLVVGHAGDPQGLFRSRMASGRCL